MRRRHFIQLVGLMSVGALFASPLEVLGARAAPLVAAPDGLMYRGDRRGRIYLSSDGGASWALHTNLGPGISVTRLTMDRAGRVAALVRYRGRPFSLVLAADGARWMTA